MNFVRINMLFLIWIVPLAGLIFFYGGRRRRRILERFAHARTRHLVSPGGLSVRRRWRAALVLLALLLMVVSLAGPQYGFRWQAVEQRGVDLIIALDCSRSMLAQDIQPTRLDRAKREIYDLLAMLQGDRVGLVAFSGTAFLQCPLTMDYQAFHLFLEVLTPDYLPVGGTDLAAAVHTATEGFEPESPAEKAIILITDGEHTGLEAPMDAVRAAQKAGITLFCIGVGSDQGVPVPMAKGGFAKDSNERIVLSRLDEALLSRMATTTGGTYVRSMAGDMDLDAIYRDHIHATMEQARVEGGRKQVWSDRYQWFLAPAVLLLLAGLWIPAPRDLRWTAMLLLMILLPATGHAQPAAEGYKAYEKQDYGQALKHFIDGQLNDPDNPELLYNLGNSYYKTGDYDAAANHFLQSLQKADPGLRPGLLYNLGNTAYRRGQLQESIDYYQKALELTPDDTQAQENLAFVKKQLQQQSSQQNDSGESSQKDGQKNQDQGPGQQPQDQSGQQQQPDQGDQQAGQSPDRNPEPPGDQNDQQRGGAPEQAQPSQDNAGKQPQQPSMAERALNRLKDEPGRALMPRYEKRRVEKDW